MNSELYNCIRLLIYNVMMRALQWIIFKINVNFKHQYIASWCNGLIKLQQKHIPMRVYILLNAKCIENNFLPR